MQKVNVIAMAAVEQRFDLDLLPEKAKEELFEFYEFLVFKYHRNAAREGERPHQSKWAQLVQRVEQNPVHLAGYGEQLKQDMREFRETFVFKNCIQAEYNSQK